MRGYQSKMGYRASESELQEMQKVNSEVPYSIKIIIDDVELGYYPAQNATDAWIRGHSIQLLCG